MMYNRKKKKPKFGPKKPIKHFGPKKNGLKAHFLNWNLWFPIPKISVSFKYLQEWYLPLSLSATILGTLATPQFKKNRKSSPYLALSWTP